MSVISFDSTNKFQLLIYESDGSSDKCPLVMVRTSPCKGLREHSTITINVLDSSLDKGAAEVLLTVYTELDGLGETHPCLLPPLPSSKQVLRNLLS